MKRSVLLSLALVALLLPTMAFAQALVFTAPLVGANEPDGGDVDGTGMGVMTISGTTLTFLVTQNNLSAITGTHIHRGSTGGIVIGFQPSGQSAPTYTNGVATGSVGPVAQALIDEIVANPSAFYLNVHSTEKPGGAIRGSLSGGTLTLAGGNGAPGTGTASTCTDSDTAICLNGGRFKVEATWAANGQTGVGHGVKLTNDTAYFWFFSSSNVEITVKVLNACSLAGAKQWVFASGLTNVQVSLKVTDTSNGNTRTYTNPNGAGFLPVQDTSAFACP